MSMKHHVLASRSHFPYLGKQVNAKPLVLKLWNIYIYVYIYIFNMWLYIYMYNYIYIYLSNIIYHTDPSGFIHLSNLSKSTPKRRIRCHALLYSLVASPQAPKVTNVFLLMKLGLVFSNVQQKWPILQARRGICSAETTSKSSTLW